jgi:hypothetical protein
LFIDLPLISLDRSLAQELAECTFQPQTHEAPAYITRIAKSVKQARQQMPPPPPSKPDWR